VSRKFRQLPGHRRRVRRGGYATRQAAEQALEQLQIPGRGVLAVADWLVTWLDAWARLREKTRRGYAAHIYRYLIPRTGSMQVGRIVRHARPSCRTGSARPAASLS
jgi:hypothetical protein